MKLKYLIWAGLFLFLGSCDKESQAEKDEKLIRTYLADRGLAAEETSSGLFYVVTDLGTGKQPNSGSRVKVAYKGYFTDGKVFDESNGSTFYLNQVIRGWQVGIPLFKEGGSGILLVPSALAYGNSGSGGVPPNTILIFDIELQQVLF